MVSTLWKACQDGDENRVEELLNDSTIVDIEIKDHTGVTPLIQAVKGGHVNIVKALLAKGADPTNASAQARPETYTTDPYILHLLAAARGEPVMSYPDPAQYYPYPQYAHYPGYPDPSAQWYPHPPPPPPPPLQVPLQAHQGPQEGEHAANLPPPEVARNIPCRYYPACRYGSACVFAHPQTPYFPGPLPPPAQYGPPPAGPPQHSHPPPQHQHPPQQQPYDPAPYPQYYPVPVPVPVPISPPFAPPHGHPHPLQHPTSPPTHMRTHSEVLSPPPFSPGSGPIPVLGPGPGPGAGGAPGPGPGQVPHPLPVQYLPPPMSPGAYQMYTARRGSVTSVTSYPSPVALEPSASVLKDGGMMNGGMNGSGNGGGRGGEGPNNGRQRRGSAAGFRDARGPSYGGRKPPCLFFPSGRCRNGDGCRFPHIAPENGPPPSHQPRGHNYPPRSRAGYYGGYGNLEERLAGMGEPTSLPPNSSQGYPPAHTNDPPSSSTSSTHLPPLPGSAPASGGKPGKGQYHGKAKNHGSHSHTGPAQSQPQRVPSADEFPVLQSNGYVNPPAHTRGSSSNSHSASSAGPGVGSGSGPDAGAVADSTRATAPSPLEGLPKVKPGAASGTSATSASTPTATPGGTTIPLHTPTIPASNGHAHMNGWANAMNGTGPTAAQLLRERERGEREREREREKGTGSGVGSGRSSPRVGKEAKPLAGGSFPAGTGKSLSTKTSTTSLNATPGSGSENLASKSKPASEVQVSA